ncbi:F-box protein At1g11270 [Spinacia oleracea]|uniref:F-box protein At1g11270 n=1 Tax=Spinacia oleracea TaxID=3562 RepID=A0A9R0K4V3_SPIOL|nr:F-box protein At1g11270-like [Spinacia oleracea]
MSDIPPEVINKILERLPVKSLLRFKCVSKTWYSLISNRNLEFAINNLKHCLSSNDNTLLAIFNDNWSLQSNEFDIKDPFSPVTRFDLGIPSEYDSEDYCFNARIVGSCNGLVAVVLDGCLCLMVSLKTELFRDTNVWVMKEYGVKESWAPLFSLSEIDIFKPLPMPLIAFSKDEFLGRQDVGYVVLRTLPILYADSNSLQSLMYIAYLVLRTLHILYADNLTVPSPGVDALGCHCCVGSLVLVPNGVPQNRQ